MNLNSVRQNAVSRLALRVCVLLFTLGIGSCADNPVQPNSPSQPVVPTDSAEPTSPVSPQAIRAVSELLEDPLVRVLLDAVQDESTARILSSLVQQASDGAMKEDPTVTQAALAELQIHTGEAVNPIDAVLLSALSLVFDHASSLIAAEATQY